MTLVEAFILLDEIIAGAVLAGLIIRQVLK